VRTNTLMYVVNNIILTYRRRLTCVHPMTAKQLTFRNRPVRHRPIVQGRSESALRRRPLRRSTSSTAASR
jgi:hypothetical protein